MKLRIVKWKYVIDRCGNDKRMLYAFQRFYNTVKCSRWKKPQDVVHTFKHTDLITCTKEKTSRLIFNIGHNKYRLITGYFFANNQTVLYVKFVGSHKEYDKVDPCQVDIFKKK